MIQRYFRVYEDCLLKLTRSVVLCGLATVFQATFLWGQTVTKSEPVNVPAWIDDQTTPADLLPDSTVLYAEVAPFEKLWTQPIRERLFDSELMQTILKNPDINKARDGIRLAEVTLGKKLPLLLQDVSRGGFVVAVDRAKDTAALFIAGENAEDQQKLARTLMNKAAQLQGRDDGELPSNEYRGVSAYKLPEGGFALLGKWVVVVNKGEIGKAIIDRYLDGPKESLSQSPQFAEAKSSYQAGLGASTESSLAWLYVDVNVLREAGIAKKVLQDRPDDFGAELLFGGLFNILRNTPHVTAELTTSSDQLSLAMKTPFAKEWVSEAEAFFFGNNVTGNALPPLRLSDSLATVTTYRDISALWLYAGDLFGEKVNDQLVQAESTLTTLFSGKDFGEEILGAFQPEVRMVSTAARFEKDQPIPAVQVPAFALVAQMKEPEKMRRELKRIFQSFIGFINVAGAMDGQPQFDQEMDKVGNAELVIARYAWDDSHPASKEIPIQYNFTPCLLIIDNYMVLSSTETLARELIEPLQKEKASSQEVLTIQPDSNLRNTYLEMTGKGIGQALEQNREQLIANNMLEKGHSREEAEAEMDVLTQIVKMVSKLVIDFEVGKEANLNFELHVGSN